MSSADKKESSERSVSLFNFTYVVAASGVGYVIFTKLAGKADPIFTAGVLAVMGVVVPLAAYMAYKRRLANGDLALPPAEETASESGVSLSDKLDRFLYSPALENNVFTFTRAHTLRALPMSFGGFAVFAAALFLGAPASALSPQVWTGILCAGVVLMAAGFFWRFKFTLNLKERTLTTGTLFGRSTVPVKAIGAEACWVLGTNSNQIVLHLQHALFAYAGDQIVRISDFEKPEKPVFSAAQDLARTAGVPFARGTAQATGTSSSGPAVYLEMWMIALPVSFIVTMLAMQFIRALH